MYKSYTKNVLNKLDKAQELALEAIGYYVESRAALLSPVDTGRLRNSIEHEVENDKTVIGTDVEYSVDVEKGTSKQRAQPYFTPAAENNIKAIESLARETIQQNMKGKTKVSFKEGFSK